MKKVLIIQPHSDDVMFSASDFLFNKGKKDEVKILTVEFDQKRIEEDKEMCSLFGVELLTLETKVDSKNFHKEYYSEHKEMDDESALEFCIGKIGKKTFNKLADELDAVLKFYSKKGYKVITCLGVGHPFHWLVRELTKERADLFYRDFPHSYKRRNQNYINGLVNSDYELKSTGDTDNHELKMEIIEKVYRTQSSLLFFEKRYIDKKLTEEFYEKVEN